MKEVLLLIRLLLDKEASSSHRTFTVRGYFTDHVALALVFRAVVVPGLVPVRRPLPGVLEDGVDHGFADQDAQIHDEEGVHGPAGEAGGKAER